MSKTITAYRNYSATDIKNRAEVPNAGDMTVSGSNVLCDNITTTKVESALGLSLASHPVSTLCTHANVNHWSAFGPTKRRVTSGVLENYDPTNNYQLGSFAGYNHGAETPYYEVGVDSSTYFSGTDASITFSCKAHIGEITYGDIDNESQAQAVAFSLWNGGTFLDHRIKTLSSLTNIADFDYNAADRIMWNVTATGTYTTRIEILDQGTYDYTGTNTICKVPGLPNLTKYVRKQVAAYIDVRIGPYSYYFNLPSFNATTGILQWNDGNITHTYTSMYIDTWIEVFNMSAQAYQQVTSTTRARNAASYTSGDSLGNWSADIWNLGGTVPDYDSIWVIYVGGS